MKVCFCTNIWNHHQGPVAKELAALLPPGDFRLFVYQPLDCDWSRERIAMGWNLMPPDEPWIVGPPKTARELKDGFFQGWIESADVLIFGENNYFDQEALSRRLEAGKLTFRTGERLLKRPVALRRWLDPRFWHAWCHVHRKFSRPSLHYLTMSHWCADDLQFYRACKSRIWRWGYLTNVSATPTEKPLREKVRIGWCGRFLNCKNVSDILTATSLLEESLRDMIDVIIVGDGPEKENLIRRAHNLGLDSIVAFKPFLPQKEALAFMESIDIFPFPSSRIEGWGAVLPEAMDKCCAVIASEDAGSTLELVRDGENGFTFKAGDVMTLSKRIATLVKDASLRRRLGFAAWKTMQSWSPTMGARRLLSLSERLLSGSRPPFSEGLCENVG